MIRSAQEFYRLRTSSEPKDYTRAASEPAEEAVWLDVIESYPEMRFWAAQNKTVPLSVLRMLARDEDSRVRSMVAMKRKLDEDSFVLLASDRDAGVRHHVACNPKTPIVVLQRLSQDPEPFVAVRALENLKVNLG